jgi:hypothetical protein
MGSESPFKSRLIRFFLAVSSILVADFFVNLLNKYLLTLTAYFDVHIVVLIGMGITLILFYMVIINIDKLSEGAVAIFVQLGRMYLGRWLGLFITVAGLLYVIYAGYYWIWFDKNFFHETLMYAKIMAHKIKVMYFH